MNKELKEILDKISSEKYYIQHSYCRLFNYEANTLLDYVTNLQQENERLKERVAYLERSNDRREDTIIGLRLELAEQEDYKSRCEKAIEYIRSNEWTKDYEISNCRTHLLNILQNGDVKNGN